MQRSKIPLVFLIAGILLGAVVVYSLPAQTFTISGGTYPSAASYTMYVESGIYYAKSAAGALMDADGDSNATTVWNNVISAMSTSDKLTLKRGVYSCDGVLSTKDDITVEGESRGKHQDYTSGSIIQLTTATATLNLEGVEGIRLKSLTIQGSNIAKGITLGDPTGKNGNFYFEDLFVRNCTYGLYSTGTTGFYDSYIVASGFQFCDVGVQLSELMNVFQNVVFGKNKVAIEFREDGTTGFHPAFYSCVWSGNDYDFDVTNIVGLKFSVYTGWFESEGLRSLGMGNGNLFTNSSALNVGTKGLTFENCYFSDYTRIDLSWIDYGAHYMRLIVFRSSNFQGQNNLTFFTLHSGYYPRFENSWRYDTSGGFHWLTWQEQGATASISDGGTISHGLFTTPTLVIASGSVASEFVSVTAKGATTFTVAIKKDDGTAGTSQTIYWIAEYDG